MFELGSSLRDARTRQGLDHAELELRTKIRAKYLRLLEEEQFDQLPAHTYIKGFLRTYAEALGLDGQIYVDEYNSRFVSGDEETGVRARRTPSPGPRDRSRRQARRESRILVLALAAIAIVTALVIAAWRFGGPGGTSVQGLSKAPVRPTATVRPMLVVRGLRGASYVDVRARSRAGKPLFQGTLLRGDVQRFTQRALWLHVTAPKNVRVVFQGRRIAVPRSGELTLGVGVSR